MISKIKRIDLSLQWKKEKKYLLPTILNVFKSGNYVGGDIIDKLEREIAKFCGTNFAICTNSGTDALTLSLYVLNIKKNDEVITVPNSFIASTSSIVHVGAKPIFVDVRDDQLMDVNQVESKITKKTKAIMPVHLCGRMVEMDKLKKIAKKHQISIIEDAAQSIGSKFNNKLSGSFGDIGCFSAHPLKNLNACGDGGFIVTNSKEYYSKLKLLINHGLKNRNESVCFGYVSRMDNLQASILYQRLKSLKKKINKRRIIAKLYFNNLKDMPITIPYEKKKEFNTYHLFVIQTDKRDKLKNFLRKKGIETGIHYPIPIHLQKAAKKMNYKKNSFKNAEKQAKQILSLPIHENLKFSDVEYICKMMNLFFHGK